MPEILRVIVVAVAAGWLAHGLVQAWTASGLSVLVMKALRRLGVGRGWKWPAGIEYHYWTPTQCFDWLWALPLRPWLKQLLSCPLCLSWHAGFWTACASLLLNLVLAFDFRARALDVPAAWLVASFVLSWAVCVRGVAAADLPARKPKASP